MNIGYLVLSILRWLLYAPAMLFAVLVSHGRIVQACDAVKNKTPLLA